MVRGTINSCGSTPSLPMFETVKCLNQLTKNLKTQIQADSLHSEQIAQNSTELLQGLIDQYRNLRAPLNVDFRQMVDWISYGERASHMMHLYPAKLLPHIPAFFLTNNLLSCPGDTVLDPFSGSGTVSLEALLAGRKPVAADSNPLARLISKVKTTPIERSILNDSYLTLTKRIKIIDAQPPSNVINLQYWFSSSVITNLSKIKAAIDEITDDDLKDFFLVCFSNTIKKVSLADPRISVPVRLKDSKSNPESDHSKATEKLMTKLKNINAINEFEKCVVANIDRMTSLVEQVGLKTPRLVLCEDARSLKPKNKALANESIQLIVTSPPYAGAQKYIRSSSLSLGWLGFCDDNTLRDYEKLNIGREHHSKVEYMELVKTQVSEADALLEIIYQKNKLRAYIAAKYLLEMRDAFLESYRVLKKNGYLVLVAAPNEICGMKFETHKYLAQIAKNIGLKIALELVDDIHSRGLMTKRNKTASIINSEWILVFSK